LIDTSNDSLNFESSLKIELKNIMAIKIMDLNNSLNFQVNKYNAIIIIILTDFFYQSNTSRNATANSVNDVVMNEKILLKHLSFSLYRLSKSEHQSKSLQRIIEELNDINSLESQKNHDLEGALERLKEKLTALEDDKLKVEKDLKLSKRQLNEKKDEIKKMTDNHEETIKNLKSDYCQIKKIEEDLNNEITAIKENFEIKKKENYNIKTQLKEISEKRDENIQSLNDTKRQKESLKKILENKSLKIEELENIINEDKALFQSIRQKKN
jgi:structural maintenance of chromosome 4